MTNKSFIKHIEFWVSDLGFSIKFYKGIFKIIGWKLIEKNAFSNGETKIYFVEQNLKARETIGPRHLCFLANSRKAVNEIAKFLTDNDYDIIRGPIESRYKNRDSYSVDFRDPDGYIIEVATESVVFQK